MKEKPHHFYWKPLGSGMLGFSLQSVSSSRQDPTFLSCHDVLTEMPGDSAGFPGTESGDEIFFDGCHAQLRFERPGSTLAQAQGFHDVWSFKRCGVWQPWISIRRVGKDRDLGLFRLLGGQPGLGNWRASLVFRDVGEYLVEGRNDGMLSLSGAPDKSALVELIPAGLPMAGAEVRVSRNLGVSEIFLLSAFLWYLAVVSALEDRSGPFLSSLGFGKPEPALR